MPTIRRVAASGDVQKVNSFIMLDPACHSLGQPKVNILDMPQHGQVLTEQRSAFPSFPTWNTRSRCNQRKVPATITLYQSQAGFRGEDGFVIEYVGTFGEPTRVRYQVDVR